jgi:outer membrane protein assembly factor BamB
LGGIAANERYVLFGDRDFDDFRDAWKCCSAETGELLWTHHTLAIGNLDYGNTPRATPLIDGERAFLLGAFGHLLCVRLTDGETLWSRDLRGEFGLDQELPWGYCGSPLLVDGRLIVAPGGPDASLVALAPDSGEVLWKTAGNPPSYGSLIVGEFGGTRQLVGHDATTLGGWDVETGQRLWTLTPESPGDFNVPTPLNIDGKLLVTSESNGTRLYRFRDDGTIDPQPVASQRRLAPDMSTPIAIGSTVFCVHRTLVGLDLNDALREVCRQRDPALGDYASVIADSRRLLVLGKGELLLLDTAPTPRISSRMRLFPEQTVIFSHPALVGTRLYARGENRLICLELGTEN